MTLRRLNLKIQGFPESYAAEPFMEEDMVVGEPRDPHPVPGGSPQGTMPLGESSGGPPPSGHPIGRIGSPIRSSPIAEDPITGAA